MPDRSEPTYSPVADPRDPLSIPDGLGAQDELHVPLPPRRDPARRAPALRRLIAQHRVVAGFCYSDRLLLQWERRVGDAERVVARLAPRAALTLDVPFYGFMTPAQRERAHARALGAIVRATRLWEPQGTEPIPLVKGLGPTDWLPQLNLASNLGLRRAAFYAREALLERDEPLIRSFIRTSHAMGLRPLLVGLFRPRPVSEGSYDAASQRHYVLARRGRLLAATGRDLRLQAGTYSTVVRRFLDPGDIAGLNQHNYWRARGFFRRPAPLTDYAM